MFEFADGVGCHTFGVFFLYFDLFDGDLLRGVRFEVAEKYDGVGALTELLACRIMLLEMCSKY